MSLPWTKLDLLRARYSDTYINLKPGVERSVALNLWAHASQFGGIVDEESDLIVAGCGFSAEVIRDILPKAGFNLDGKKWINRVSYEYFAEADEYHRERSRSGKKGRMVQLGLSPGAEPTGSDLRPSVPPSVPPSVLRSVLRSDYLCAQRYLQALQMRKGRTPRDPAPGVLNDVAAKIRKRHDEGHEFELLAALPALQTDGTFQRDGESVLDRMLSRPEALLGENANRTGTHATRIRESLSGLVVNERQKAILEAIGSWEWCEAQGVTVKAKVVVR